MSTINLNGRQASYVEEGKDPKEPTDWAYYHLQKCLHPYIDARECVVEKKVAVVREMKEKMSPEQWDNVQKRLRFAAHKSFGVEKFDQVWNPDLDFKAYFQAFRDNAENGFKLEQEYIKETAGGRDPVDPGKYIPRKFWKTTQIYFDEKNN